MHKVDQTITAEDPIRLGNCFAACVATALGLPLGQVPHFVEWGVEYGDDEHSGIAWWSIFLGFVLAKGLLPTYIESPTDASPEEVVFVAGLSERGVPHQVLYMNGCMWHDPHPSRAGLLTVYENQIFVLRPINGSHNHAPTKNRKR